MNNKYSYLILTICFVLFCFTFIFAEIPSNYTGKPYSGDTLKGNPQQIPGVVKAVFFDEGGEGIAFHDVSPGNTGGSMRKNASGQQIQADLPVDMQAFTNAWDYKVDGTLEPTGSWHLSWIDPGEWLKYTVHVNIAGTYYIAFHQATAVSPNAVSVQFNEMKPDTIRNLKVCTVPPGCPEVWHAWDIYEKVDSVTLDTGLYVLKFQFIQGSWNFDWLKFTLKSTTNVSINDNNKSSQNGLNLTHYISNNIININFSLNNSEKIKIYLCDLTGKKIIQLSKYYSLGNNIQQINIINVPKGIYLLNVKNDLNILITRKIFIK
jgi:hypothetical protein